MDLKEPEEVFDVPEGAEEGTGKEPAGAALDDLRILEAVLFASDELITAGQLKTILPSQPDARKIRGMVEKINIQLQKERHPFEIVEIGGGYQFRTITYYHPWVRQIFKEKATKRLSIQALESLAVIAYKQPISKAEIEAIRGVVSDGAMKTLLEKRLITVAGRSEKPGRPLLYGTTQVFLKYFGLNKIDDLPRIEEFEAMAREKMEDLTIDELARPETVPDDETDVSVGEGNKGSGGVSGKVPEESSLFEVEITATPAVKEQQEAAPPAEERTGDEPADFEVGAGTEAMVTTAAAATVSDIEEEAFEVHETDSAAETAGGGDTAATEENAPAAPAAEEKLPVAADSAAVKPETAFDLEVMVTHEKPVEEKPQPVVKKIKREFVEGAALRGETAFDLEAIVIEEPVIPMPVKKAVDEKADVFKVTARAPAEEEFDLEASSVVGTAVPAENGAAFEVPKAEAAETESAPFNLEDAIEEVAPVTSPADDEGAETFEIAKPAAKTGAAFEFEDAVDALTAADEEEALFEMQPTAPSPKSSDAGYFEVRGADAPADHYQEACDTLAEALKETAVILPDKIKKSSKKPSGTKGKATGAKGKTAGAKGKSAGTTAPRKKSAGSAGGTAKKQDVGKSSVRKPRGRRGSGPEATGAA